MTLRSACDGVLAAVCCAAVMGCHRYETVNDVSTMAGVRGKVVLTAEARASNARRLGGVAMEVVGLATPIGTDSISIKTDEVRFADLGTVPYAQGELHFALTDVQEVQREVFDRRRSGLFAAVAVVGAAIAGTVFAPGNGIFGIGREPQPTPR